MAISVDPDETAHYEPSHLYLHCLQKKNLSQCTGLKGISILNFKSYYKSKIIHAVATFVNGKHDRL